MEAACAEQGMKKGTVACWAARDYRGFRERYFAAFAAKILAETDRMLELVDGVLNSDSMARVNAAKNAADVRRWLASKMLGEFSERVEHQVSGGFGVRIYRVECVLPDKRREQVIDGQAQLLEGGGSEDS